MDNTSTRRQASTPESDGIPTMTYVPAMAAQAHSEASSSENDPSLRDEVAKKQQKVEELQTCIRKLSTELSRVRKYKSEHRMGRQDSMGRASTVGSKGTKRSSSTTPPTRAATGLPNTRRAWEADTHPSKMAKTSTSPLRTTPRSTTPRSTTPRNGPHTSPAPSRSPGRAGHPRSRSAGHSRPMDMNLHMDVSSSNPETPDEGLDRPRMRTMLAPLDASMPDFFAAQGPPTSRYREYMSGSPDSMASENERLRAEKVWVQWQYERQLETMRRQMEKENNERVERLKRAREVEYVRWKRETLQEMKRYRKEVEEKEEQKHVLSTKLHLVQSEVQNLKRDKNASVNALNAEMQLSAKLNQQVTDLYTQLQQARMSKRQLEHQVEKKESERQLIIGDRNRLRKALSESAHEIQYMKQQVANLAQHVEAKRLPLVPTDSSAALLQTQVASLAEELQQRNTEAAELRAQTEALDQRLVAAEQLRDAAEVRASQFQDKAEALQLQLRAATEQAAPDGVHDLQQALNAAVEHAEGLEQQVAKLQSQSEELQAEATRSAANNQSVCSAAEEEDASGRQKELEDQIDALESQVGALQVQVSQQQQHVAEEQTKSAQWEADLEELQQSYGQRVAELAALKSRVSGLEVELDAARGDGEREDVGAQREAALRELQCAHERKAAEVDALQRRISEFEAESADSRRAVERLEEALRQHVDDAEELRRQLAAQRGEMQRRDEEWEGRVEALQRTFDEEAKDLADQLQKAQATKMGLEGQLQHRDAQEADGSERLSRVTSELQETQKVADSQALVLQDLELQLQGARDEKAELTEELARQSAKVSDAVALEVQVVSMRAENAELAGQLEAAAKERADVQERLQGLCAAEQAKVGALEAQLEELQSDVEAEQERAAELESQLSSARAASAKDATALAAQLEQLQSDADAERERAEELEDELRAARAAVTEGAKMTSALQAQLDEAAEEVERLQASTEGVHAEERQERDRANALTERLERAQTDLEAEQQRATELEEQLSLAEDRHAEEAKKAAALEAELRGAAEQIEGLQASMAGVHAEAKRAGVWAEELEHAQRALEAEQRQAADLDYQLCTAEAARAKDGDRIAALQVQLDHATNQVRALQAARDGMHAAAQANISDLQSDVHHLEGLVAERTCSQAAAMRESETLLHAQHEQLGRVHEGLKQMGGVKDELAASEQRARALEEQCQSLADREKALLEQLQLRENDAAAGGNDAHVEELQDQVDAMQMKALQLQQEASDEKKKSEAIEAELKQLQQLHEQTVAELDALKAARSEVPEPASTGAQSEDLQNQVEELLEEVSAERDKSRKWEEDFEELKESFETKVRELDALAKEKNEHLEASRSCQQQVEELENQVGLMQSKTCELMEEIATEKQNSDKCAAELEDLQQVHERTLAEMYALKAENGSDKSKQQVEELEQQVETLQTKTLELMEQIETEKNSSAKLETEMTNLAQRHEEALAGMYASQAETANDSKQQVQQLEKQVGQMEEKMKQQQQQLDDAQEENMELEAQVKHWRSQESEGAKQLADAQRTVRDLEGRLHEACERPQGRSDGAAAAEDTELRSAVQRLEKQVVDLTAARGSLLAEKEAVMRESYDRMQRFEAACAKLQRQPREDGAPGNGVAGDAAALEAQCTALRERVQAMEGQCAEWERAAEEADRQLQSERALGRGLQTELDARAQAADAALRRAEDVEVQWRQLQGTVNELDRQLEAERARAAAAQPQHAADAGLAEAVELLEAQVVALTEERAARLTTELSEAQAHMARLEAVETLARRHQQLVADGGGQGELEELRRRAEEGERQVAVKAQEAETARQEAMMCLAEIQELKRKGGSSPAPDSRKALEDAQKENAQLKQVIFEKDKELAAKQAAGGDGEEELRQELQKKQERIGQLKVQIAELNKKLNDKLNEKR